MMTAIPAERRSIFGSAGFVRLWSVGAIANITLWFEVLAASLFTFDITHSGWAVAVVSAARAAPLLGLGAIAGVLSDAWNRKLIVIGGLTLSALAAGTVSLLAYFDQAGPAVVAVAALVSGAVYATEMPARRRMIAESAGVDRIDRAVAADGVTNYAARCVGPVLGGWAYQHAGLSGAFLFSTLCSLAGIAVILGLEHRQAVRRVAFSHVRSDLSEALVFARGRPIILMLLAVTVTMNLFGYSYSTLVAPIAKLAFDLDATRTGFLAAAEPAGALLGGLALMRIVLPGSRLGWLMGGVSILTGGLLAAALAGMAGASFVAVCVILAAGGVGSAVYTNNQTSIVMAETPTALRSRIMGLVTICIGSWPIGMLIAGGLVACFPPLAAMAVLAVLGLALVAALAFGQRAIGSRP